jgi:hypothetical protein
MMFFRSWTEPGAHWLGRHLARLRENLESLCERLRAAVALAVGTTVASAVREMVHALLDETNRNPEPLARSQKTAAARWKDPWLDDRDEHDPWREMPYESEPPEDFDSPTPEEVKRTGSARWCRALSAGLQAAAWWLRRRATGLSLVTAVGVAAAVTLAGYAGGPLALAGWGLARSALVLFSLTETVQSGAATLATFSNG